MKKRPAILRHLTTPVVLVAAALALYAWVQSRDLDRIEQRVLTGDVVLVRTLEHLKLTGLVTVLVVVIAIPLGVALTRPRFRHATPATVTVANLGQAAPALGLLVLLAVTVGVGTRTAVIALAAYTVLPVLRNTMVGLRQVDPALVEAARGLGFSRTRALRRVELPLAVPVILAGVRTALVISVGTAALAVYIAAGGLGAIIDAGIATGRTTVLVTGAMLTALVALTVDWLASVAEDALRPEGL